MVRGFEARIPAAGLRNFILALKPLNLFRLSIPETPIIFLNIRNPIATRKKQKIWKNLIRAPKRNCQAQAREFRISSRDMIRDY